MSRPMHLHTKYVLKKFEYGDYELEVSFRMEKLADMAVTSEWQLAGTLKFTMLRDLIYYIIRFKPCDFDFGRFEDAVMSPTFNSYLTSAEKDLAAEETIALIKAAIQ